MRKTFTCLSVESQFSYKKKNKKKVEPHNFFSHKRGIEHT